MILNVQTAAFRSQIKTMDATRVSVSPFGAHRSPGEFVLFEAAPREAAKLQLDFSADSAVCRKSF